MKNLNNNIFFKMFIPFLTLLFLFGCSNNQSVQTTSEDITSEIQNVDTEIENTKNKIEKEEDTEHSLDNNSLSSDKDNTQKANEYENNNQENLGSENVEPDNQTTSQNSMLIIAQAEEQKELRPIQTNVKKPTASGEITFSSGSAEIDASNTSEGYIMVKYSGSCNKIKLQLTKNGHSTYTFNLHKNGFEVFPLSEGSGTYTINVFENVSGNQYALNLGEQIEVSLNNSFSPFLYPNQYINFFANSKTVAKGEELAKTATNDLEVVANVYNYVIDNITYDDYKASHVKSGYLPVVDDTLATKKGICFDYAALMTAMLRSQNIPTKLVVGYASGGIYHSWLSTYIKDIGWVDGIIYFDGQSWKRMDPTFAANDNSSDSIMNFIGDGSNYTAKYIY